MIAEAQARFEREYEINQSAADAMGGGGGEDAPEETSSETPPQNDKPLAVISVNFGLPEDRPDISPTAGMFPAGLGWEAETGGRRAFEEVINQAAIWPTLFSTWDEKLQALAIAYDVMQRLLRHGDVAIDLLMDHPHFDGLKRKPSRKNLAVLALRLVAKPQDDNDHKAVSDWAAMLNWAKIEDIDPRDFIRRANATSLRACRDLLRNRAGKAKPRQGAGSDSSPAGAATIVLTFSGGDHKRITLHFTLVEEQALRAFDANRADPSLTAFAEAILKAPA